MYCCKKCGRPVEVAIEGELICTDCWSSNAIPAEMAQQEAEVAQWLAWLANHCEDCDRLLPGGGVCSECQADRKRLIEKLGW